MGTVLQGGKIITASNIFDADIRIEGEVISDIGLDVMQSGDEVIDVSGCLIFPGGIDVHTHFDLDVGFTTTSDNFETGTKAAIHGGTTTIINYATQYKGETLKQAFENEFNKAQTCYCDFGIHMGITDWNEHTSEEMQDMIDVGVTSFKLYMAYKNNLQVDDGVIYQVLKRSKEVGGLVTFHCENGDVIDTLVKLAVKEGNTSPKYHALTRPAILEKEAISRVIDIASLLNVPVYIVHLSTEQGLDAIIQAKNLGKEVYAETCPQYLFLDDSLYEHEGEKYVMSPPLRKKVDNQALWLGLADDFIDTIATDHCTFNHKGQKDFGKDDFRKIPNGGPGVEDRFSLIYTYGVLTGRLTLQQFVAKISTTPAKLFGLYPKKGEIAVGSNADIVVLDPHYETIISAKTQLQNVDYNPYEGMARKGFFRYVFLRGRRMVENEIVVGLPCGQYIHRHTFKGGE